MEALRGLGVEFSLDDFGTGYSSLSYLHRLPASYLKIDRSFVGGMMQSRINAAIVQTIIGLAQSLKMQVVAEGIETAEQFEQLRMWGCEFGQGYFLAKPLDPKDAKDLIGRRVSSTLSAVARRVEARELNNTEHRFVEG